jgi:ubiquitin carboxyl-terminal hydrolase 34
LEATLLLDAGFLRKTLEIVSADSMLPITQQYQRMLAIISKRLTTRPVSFDAVLTLLSTLIKVCDPALDPINDDKERWRLSLDDLPIPFNDSERHLLTQHWTRNSAHILVEKLLYINQNRQAIERILVDLLNWPETLDTFILNAIIAGIRRPLNAHPCGSFLNAAYTYCVHSKSARAVFSMATTVSKIAAHSDSSEGKDFLHFFSRIYAFIASIDDNVTSKKALQTFFFDQVPVWAPSLLTNYDATVRRDTLAFLTEIMFMENMDEWSASQEDDDEKEKAIALTAQKLGFACLKYVNDVYIHQRQQAVRVQLVPIEKVIESCESFFDPQDALTQDFNERRDCE